MPSYEQMFWFNGAAIILAATLWVDISIIFCDFGIITPSASVAQKSVERGGTITNVPFGKALGPFQDYLVNTLRVRLPPDALFQPCFHNEELHYNGEYAL